VTILVLEVRRKASQVNDVIVNFPGVLLKAGTDMYDACSTRVELSLMANFVNESDIHLCHS
jgi:hypothetical protein